MLAIRPFASFVRYCVRKLVPVLPVLLMLVLAFGTAQAQTGVPATPDIQLPPGTNAVPPPDDPPPSSPYDSAAVVSISAPATMVAGSTANVAVTMRNTGNTVWDSGVTNPYRLGSLNPANNVTWGIGRVELVSTVEAGGQAVFNFKITAPSTPGTYSFSWGMLRELLFWFGATASSTISVTAPPPVYDAQLVSASVPTTMTAGSYYNVSLTFKNTGNVTWSQSDYRIGSTSPDDNTTWGLNRVNMSAASVAPGQSATFSFQAKAPAAAGTYLFDWGMLWELHWRFGQTSRTYVTVNPVATTPKPTVSASHTTMVAGQSFTMGWSTTNASSLTHVCTAAGTGYTVSESVAVSGSRSLTAQAGWVNYPSSCTWTASGPGGSATFTETLTTVAGTSGSVTYIYTDGLGSPVARTDASGTVISRTRYEPYGYVASGVQPTIGFTGHVNDVDTGLTYMQQRYYDPVAGRFLSIDPVTTDANTGSSFNRYAYAKNNPYVYVDPDGRRDIYIGGAADKNNTKIVQDYAGAQKKANPGRDIQYFSYSEKKEITAAVNAPLKAGEPLNVIGHSLGGREAVNQANNTGAQITNLVTIDPVGSAGNGTKPSNVGTWTDVTAVPSNRDFSDTVASAGRTFMGTTATSGADSSQSVSTSHGDFDGMMSKSGSQKKVDASY
jgi:RHS repeat-associated protein